MDIIMLIGSLIAGSIIGYILRKYYERRTWENENLKKEKEIRLKIHEQSVKYNNALELKMQLNNKLMETHSDKKLVEDYENSCMELAIASFEKDVQEQNLKKLLNKNRGTTYAGPK